MRCGFAFADFQSFVSQLRSGRYSVGIRGSTLESIEIRTATAKKSTITFLPATGSSSNIVGKVW